MQKQTNTTKAANKAANKAPRKGAKPAAPVAAPQAATPAPAVAVRGGLVFNTVAQVPGKVYRTKAPHNVAWWAAIAKATANGPAPVAPLLVSASNPQGVPVAFLGYCVRRGYLQAA